MLKRAFGFSGLLIALLLTGVALTGCGTRAGQVSTMDELAQAQDKIEQLEREVDSKTRAAEQAERDAQKAREEAQRAAAEARSAMNDASSSSTRTVMTGGGDAVPANAQPGECFARVLVPPTYETDSERVLVREASHRIEIVPAKYEWTEERILVKEASTKLVAGEGSRVTSKGTIVSKDHEHVEEKILVTPARTYWKKGRGPIEKVDNSTGEIMCLVEEPAVYRTVRKKIEKEPTTRVVEIPAEYKTVKVRKMVSPATEKRIEIPAEYSTVTKKTMVKPSSVEWREVLCETNMKGDIVMQIQRALDKAGHNPGPIDGRIGPKTLSAVRAFQQSKSLPTGGLTMSTIKALGIRM